MSQLEERSSVACPLAQAAMRLKYFFHEHATAEANAAKLTLGINVKVAGLPVPLTLQRSVIATIQPHHLPADMTPRYRVGWAPESPGPFPLFAGELVVESGDDYEMFTLRLSGAYTPPLGLFGKGFDVAVGNRLAHASALRIASKGLFRRTRLSSAARKPNPNRRDVRGFITMRRLTVSVPVRAPCGFMLAYVRTYFQERAHGIDVSELRLHVPLHNLAGGLSVDKPVHVELRYLPNRGAHDGLAISWIPAETAAFPRFQGVFEARKLHDVDCQLALNGSYIAPGGIAGAAFDAVLGHRIARATIESFLHQLGTAAEADYRIRVAL